MSKSRMVLVRLEISAECVDAELHEDMCLSLLEADQGPGTKYIHDIVMVKDPITEGDEVVMERLAQTIADMGGAEVGKRLKEAVDNTCHMGWEAAGYSREMMLGVQGFLEHEVLA